MGGWGVEVGKWERWGEGGEGKEYGQKGVKFPSLHCLTGRVSV